MKTLCVFWGMGVFGWMEQCSNTSPARRAGGAPRDQAMRCDPTNCVVGSTDENKTTASFSRTQAHEAAHAVRN